MKPKTHDQILNEAIETTHWDDHSVREVLMWVIESYVTVEQFDAFIYDCVVEEMEAREDYLR